MKGLLHSKRFRKNLCKWFVMYACVMAMFATVVTYSKYISNLMNVDEEARVTKFSVHAQTICDANEEEGCNIGSYRPTSKIEYVFQIDTTELEVKADVDILAVVEERFQVLEFTKQKEGTDEIQSIPFTNRILQDHFEVNSDGGVTYYRILLKRKDPNFEQEENIPQAIKIGYTATQKK